MASFHLQRCLFCVNQEVRKGGRIKLVLFRIEKKKARIMRKRKYRGRAALCWKAGGNGWNKASQWVQNEGPSTQVIERASPSKAGCRTQEGEENKFMTKDR